ncbi:acid phosphatase [[Candida] anglica]|uniref:Acid phosphatase n=1 Tax=[Candida] anglica TaxID=148631 RepID=A0ABP0E8K5_9ASCO
MQPTLALSSLLLVASASAKNILLTNDDSWVSTNIRATYRDLTSAGHNVVLVAPVSQRSGWGGKFDVPYSKTLQTDGEFGYVKAGAPSWGHEDNDKNIWYFNGTPASCVAFALNYVSPKFFNNVTFDLVVAGPNEGTNMSPGFFTGSGTDGATYNAAYRGLPAIAFSGSNGNNSFFKDSLDEDPLEPSNIYSKKVVQFVDQLFTAQGNNPRTMPLQTLYNVNLPPVGYQSKNEACTDPEWVFTRLTGQDAASMDLVWNETSQMPVWHSTPFAALSACNNGDCSLPSETWVINQNNCKSSVSVGSVDYDANIQLTNEAKALLGPLLL